MITLNIAWASDFLSSPTGFSTTAQNDPIKSVNHFHSHRWPTGLSLVAAVVLWTASYDSCTPSRFSGPPNEQKAEKVENEIQKPQEEIKLVFPSTDIFEEIIQAIEDPYFEIATGNIHSSMAHYILEELFRNRHNTYGYLLRQEVEDVRLKRLVLPQYPLQMTTGELESFSQTPDIISASEKNRKGQPYFVLKCSGEPIFYFGFPGLDGEEVQGLAFDRLSIFVEVKPGFVATDEELYKISQKMDLMGGGGHDYRLSDIARFFTQLEKKQIRLNAMEERLKQELTQAGLLTRKGNRYQQKEEVAIISTSTLRLNRSTLDHELNHAIYFTDMGYRMAAKQLSGTIWRTGSTC
jgi:hypothetical protein